MSRAIRLAAIVAALLAVTSSTAEAVTWHASGDTAFTATAGPKTLTTNPYSGFSGITCVGGVRASGTAVTGTTVTLVGLPITGTLTFTNCTSLFNPAGVDCTYRFTPLFQTGGATTTGQADTTCSVYIAGSTRCHAHGALPTTYFNPSGGATGRFTITPSALTMTDVSTGSCPFGSPSPLGFHETTLAITSATGGPAPHTGPVIVRTF